MRLHDTHPRHCGFTLVEMVVVVVILAIMAAAGAMILKRGFDAYFGGENIMTSDWQARLAFERMTRELRGAYKNTNLVVTGGTAVAFSYYDPVTVYITTVTYNLAGTTLQRISTTPGTTTDALANNVSSLTFALLKSDGATTIPSASSPSAETYYIQATVTVNATGPKGSYILTFRDNVNPRNFP